MLKYCMKEITKCKKKEDLMVVIFFYSKCLRCLINATLFTCFQRWSIFVSLIYISYLYFQYLAILAMYSTSGIIIARPCDLCHVDHKLFVQYYATLAMYISGIIFSVTCHVIISYYEYCIPIIL